MRNHPLRRMMAAVAAMLFAFFLLFVCSASAAEVEVDSGGGQREVKPDSRKVKFVNLRSEGECNLYWIGTVGGGPRLFYGPLEPNGGERTVEGFPGQVFALMTAGTYDKLAEYTITERLSPQRFELTDDNAIKKNELPEAAEESEERERTSSSCRSSAGSGSCRECADLPGCGWSVVRRGCFRSHPVGTVDDPLECAEKLPDASSKSVEAWLNRATALVLGHEGYGPKTLRSAFRALERGAEAAAEAEEAAAESGDTAKVKAAALSARKVHGMLAELSAKLDAVFDDQDASELLESSRRAALAAIHPDMPVVDRRTKAEARAYIARGEPVVITDAFNDADETTSPVAHKWTLEYLSRRVFGAPGAGARKDAEGEVEPPRFNVAADLEGQCCRYFEPQAKAQQAGYPYPFAPSTHLYRDQFDGFVKTVRKASRMSRSSSTSNRKKRVLHYLHEIVMNGRGEAVVAGGAAPPQLKADLEAVTSALEPLASDQPFFGGFASAKVWLGQRGIVMPVHYDATDNLYVMAWGRKKAIISPPGQLDALYRYPNAHPLAGSSQVNLTEPDLTLHPNFVRAKLREVIVGPGDVLYLPAWWWHQFEQPFEDTAALNLWSRDRDGAPEASLRDVRVREHSLSDQLERSVEQHFGSETGVVLGALARERAATAAAGTTGAADDDASSPPAVDRQKLDRANEALFAEAHAWRERVESMPGGHPKTERPSDDLMTEYLEVTHRYVMDEQRQSWPDWKPGVKWDLSRTAVLPRDLRERCESAPESSPFMSICG